MDLDDLVRAISSFPLATLGLSSAQELEVRFEIRVAERSLAAVASEGRARRAAEGIIDHNLRSQAGGAGQ